MPSTSVAPRVTAVSGTSAFGPNFRHSILRAVSKPKNFVGRLLGTLTQTRGDQFTPGNFPFSGEREGAGEMNGGRSGLSYLCKSTCVLSPAWLHFFERRMPDWASIPAVQIVRGPLLFSVISPHHMDLGRVPAYRKICTRSRDIRSPCVVLLAGCPRGRASPSGPCDQTYQLRNRFTGGPPRFTSPTSRHMGRPCQTSRETAFAHRGT